MRRLRGALIAIASVVALAAAAATASANVNLYTAEPPPGGVGTLLVPGQKVELFLYFENYWRIPNGPAECLEESTGELVNNQAPIVRIVFHGPWKNACAGVSGWKFLKGSVSELELEDVSGHGWATTHLKQKFEFEDSSLCKWAQFTHNPLTSWFTPNKYLLVEGPWEGKKVAGSCTKIPTYTKTSSSEYTFTRRGPGTTCGTNSRSSMCTPRVDSDRKAATRVGDTASQGSN